MVTKSAKQPATRDSDAMRGRILDAVGRILIGEGLAKVGVNAIAREAGCDKVLIYRYFGDLDGLYAAFAAQGDFWWTVGELTSGLDAPGIAAADAMKTILRRHAAAIRARPITLAVLAAELAERTPLVVALETVRERRSLELSRWIAGRFRLPRNADAEAISMLLGVAINYLAVRARKIRVMSGVPIRTDKDWERIFAALDTLIDAVFVKG